MIDDDLRDYVAANYELLRNMQFDSDLYWMSPAMRSEVSPLPADLEPIVTAWTNHCRAAADQAEAFAEATLGQPAIAWESSQLRHLATQLRGQSFPSPAALNDVEQSILTLNMAAKQLGGAGLTLDAANGKPADVAPALPGPAVVEPSGTPDAVPAVASLPKRERLIDVNEVAALAGVSTRQIYRLADGGRMPRPLKVGGANRWDRRTVETWISDGCPKIVKRRKV